PGAASASPRSRAGSPSAPTAPTRRKSRRETPSRRGDCRARVVASMGLPFRRSRPPCGSSIPLRPAGIIRRSDRFSPQTAPAHNPAAHTPTRAAYLDLLSRGELGHRGGIIEQTRDFDPQEVLPRAALEGEDRGVSGSLLHVNDHAVEEDGLVFVLAVGGLLVGA